jgi:hypothetical protein
MWSGPPRCAVGITAEAVKETYCTKVSTDTFASPTDPNVSAIVNDELDKCRERLRTTLPIRSVVGPAKVAAWTST